MEEIQPGICQNRSGVLFKIFSLPMLDHIHIANMYKCLSCHHIYFSKNGAVKHQCSNYQYFINMISHPDHILTIENLLRFICTSNCSLRCVENIFLQRAFKAVNPTIEIPKRDKLKSEMFDLANQILQKMHNDLRGKTVSILLDGCRRLSHNFQGIIIYTPDRLYFYSIYETPNSKAKTLRELVVSIIFKMAFNQIHVLSICTDNCNTNKSAFDELYFFGRHILREPCSSHTGNLAIKDMFESGEYEFVKNEIFNLLSNIPDCLCHNGNVPRLMTIRWKSMYTCVEFIYKNIQTFLETQNVSVIASIEVIENSIGWENLYKMLQIMWIFVSQTEADLASIADIVQPFLNALDALFQMNTTPAKKLAEHLENRFKKSCPLQLPFFAFLLTKEGLQYFRSDQKGSENFKNFELTITQYLIERCLCRTITLVISTLRTYLEVFNINEFENFSKPIDMWKCDQYLYTKYGIPYCFSKLAEEILSIPASEAAVERIFAALSKITTKEMCKIKTNTINSRLVIKYDSIFGNAGSVKLEDLMNDPENILKLSAYAQK